MFTTEHVQRFELVSAVAALTEMASRTADQSIFGVELDENGPFLTAIKIIRERRAPIIVKRQLSDGTFEYIDLSKAEFEIEILDECEQFYRENMLDRSLLSPSEIVSMLKNENADEILSLNSFNAVFKNDELD